VVISLSQTQTVTHLGEKRSACDIHDLLIIYRKLFFYCMDIYTVITVQELQREHVGLSK